MRAPRAPESGWTILEILLVVLLVGALLAIALPNLHATRIRSNEAAAIRALHEVVEAQELMRKAALIDANADGRGEYAFLQELSGGRNPRAYTPIAGKATPVAPLPQFHARVLPDGDAEVCGYRFRLYLPGPAGKAVGETAAGAAAEPDAALAASCWCAYAWPVKREGTALVATGTRTFFANQSGSVLGAEGDYAALPGSDGKPAVQPAPGAAFQGGNAMETITGAPAIGTLGRDGNAWRTAR